MPWIAAVGAVAGGLLTSDATGDAAAMQAGATDRANAISEKQYRQTRDDLAPYRNYGNSATNRLMYLLGLDGGSAGGAGGSGGSVDRDALRSQLLSQFTTTTRPMIQPGWEDAWVPSSGETTTIDEAGLEAAINQRVQAAQAAQFAPTGQSASSDPAFGSLLRNFTRADFEADPSYEFRRSEGLRGLESSAAARGGLFSGGTLKGLNRYNSDLASQEWGNAWNRDASQKRQKYDFLSGGASLGQNAAAMTGNAGQAMAQQVGANTTAQGNALGAASIAQGNAWGNALTGAVGGYQRQQAINQGAEQNALLRTILGGNTGWNTGSDAWRTTGDGMPSGWTP